MTAPGSDPRHARAAIPSSLAVPLVLLAGCVSGPPSHAERREFGDIAVRTAAAPHTVDWERPVTGGAAGLGMGAARGFGAIVGFPVKVVDWGHTNLGSSDLAGVVTVAGAVVSVGAAVVWIPFSVVGGATTAPATNAVDAAELVIRPIVDDPGLPDAFGARFAEAARRSTGRDLVDAARATTVAETRLVSISRGSAWNWWTFDRPFDVVIEATVRVVHLSDGRVVWEDTRKSHPDAARAAVVHTYAEWAADDGAALRSEIDLALRSLAEGFAHTILVANPTDLLGREIEEKDEPERDGGP